MQNIILDEEFRIYLPILSTEAFEHLERLLLEHGVRDALVVWNNILIDGYNRYAICIKHNIPFTTVSMEFDSRQDVFEWMAENQLGRRNLNPVEQSHYRGVVFNAVKRRRSQNNQYPGKISRHQSDGVESRSSTARELGNKFKVSSATIERDSKVANAINAIAEVSLEAKRKILSGEVPIDRTKLQRLSNATKEEIAEVATQITEGTYNRNDHRLRKSPEPSPEQNQERESGQNINPSQQPPLPNQSSPTYITTIVTQITDNLNKTLNTLPTETTLPELKTSLRTFIDSCEEIYKSIQ